MDEMYEITISDKKQLLDFYTEYKSIAIFVKIMGEAKRANSTDLYIHSTQTSYIFRIKAINFMKSINSKVLENTQTRI